jgi:hypothetical protein
MAMLSPLFDRLISRHGGATASSTLVRPGLGCPPACTASGASSPAEAEASSSYVVGDGVWDPLRHAWAPAVVALACRHFTSRSLWPAGPAASPSPGWSPESRCLSTGAVLGHLHGLPGRVRRRRHLVASSRRRRPMANLRVLCLQVLTVAGERASPVEDELRQPGFLVADRAERPGAVIAQRSHQPPGNR